MKYIILHSQNVRDSLQFDASDDYEFGPTQVRHALRQYMQDPAGVKGLYKFTAIVEADNLERVFAMTQNENAEWRVKGNRSTAVGDVVIPMKEDYDYEGDAYVVDSIGFCQLVNAFKAVA